MRRLFLLLFLLMSCSEERHEWQSYDVGTSCSFYRARKIILPPENAFRGIELEFSQTTSGMKAYLNIFSRTLPVESGDNRKTIVHIDFEEGPLEFAADCFEGGQKILLPKEATEIILSHLMANQSFTITIGRYSATIIPRRFTEAYDRLQGKREGRLRSIQGNRY